MFSATLATTAPDLDNKSVLVTGGTGSFGKLFIQLVLERYKPRRLIVLSRDELKQYEMAQVFATERHPCLRYFIGDVRDFDRLDMAFRGIDYVIHAAALKQVPAAEYNPFECIKTNVIGAENVARAAIRNGVKKVVALSTDKAASPVNLYGASKLASDKIFVAANNLGVPTGTVFSAVRYGNVVGSRGSVVPLFLDLLRRGTDHLPITDLRMTRFWITLQQGVDFVLSCLGLMQGGEIFVPKIPSMRIVDLARALAADLPLRPVGIRPGEKLHETLVTRDDARFTTEMADRYIIKSPFLRYDPYGFDVQPVPEHFQYTSDTNPHWLSEAELLRIVGSGAPAGLPPAD